MPIYQVVVTDGNLGEMKITSLGNENALYSIEWVKKVMTDISTVRKQAEGEPLKNTAEIIISVGDRTGAYLGDKYKVLSREIASNIQNFQGKRIRSYEQAMASMNKLMANPNMKINAADKTAIINAWKSFNADDMGNKFAALGKTFKLADYALKANNVREKSIEGYNTGNWGGEWNPGCSAGSPLRLPCPSSQPFLVPWLPGLVSRLLPLGSWPLFLLGLSVR